MTECSSGPLTNNLDIAFVGALRTNEESSQRVWGEESPPSSPADPEGTRLDRRWQVIRYSLVACVPVVVLVFLGLSVFQESAPEDHVPPIVQLFLFSIFTYQLILCALNYYGILRWGAPADTRPGPGWSWDSDVKLRIAYVSRGTQPGTLTRASRTSQQVLDDLNVNYAIEIVTDVEIPFQHRLEETGGEVRYYAVPKEYETKLGARYKARALQYLLEQRTSLLEGREDEDQHWILHLDEESVVTPECILGIRNHIRKYDLRQGSGAVGQGEILYNSRCYGEKLAVTVTDSLRTAQDLGHFRCSFKYHKPRIGMHGSYVLVPAGIEKRITWDVGSTGSVTEDAFFALFSMQEGVKYDWVEGFIREQSPFTLMDIARQRRRWFSGLTLVAFDPKLTLETTFVMRLALLFWGLSSLSTVLPYWFIVHRFLIGNCAMPYWLFLMGISAWALYGGQYCVGTVRNLDHCSLPLAKKVRVALASAIIWLLTIPALTEALGTLYAVFFPVKTFYIVNKDGDLDDEKEQQLKFSELSRLPR